MGLNTFPYELLRILATLFFLVIVVYGYFYVKHHKKERTRIIVTEVAILVVLLWIAFFAGKVTTGHPSLFYFGHTQGPFEYGPELPLLSSIDFLKNMGRFEKVEEIGYDPSLVPAPIDRDHSEHISIDLEAVEVIGEVTDGTTFNYWTFNKQVPGPLIRVRVGDTVTVNLKNAMSSLHTHSVDFHATTGPGGGAKVLQVPPGETKSLTWKALAPGVYIYHCASKHSVGAHNAHGQYGLIVVEPEEGYSKVDKEFYVVQGELYTRGNTGDRGLVAFDSQAMLDERPNYVIFNGRVKSLNGRMKASVGDTVRIFVGNAGVAKISSFHVIGEIFDNVHHEGGTLINHNVQSTVVPAGGATIVEFDLEVPGDYILVDHSLARMDKGAWGVLSVDGEENHEIFKSHEAESSETDSPH